MRWPWIVCLLMLPIAVQAQTEDGDRGYIQALLEDALSAEGRTVQIRGFAGALSSRATIEQITITDADGVWLTAQDLALSWNRAALLRGRVDIDEISIGVLDMPRLPLPENDPLPRPEAQGSFSLPDLPVSIDIDTLQVREASFGKPVLGQAAEFAFQGRAELASRSGSTLLDLSRQDAPGQITLKASYDDATGQLQFDLTLTEPADGIAANALNLPGVPSVDLQVIGNDPISDFTADIRLATDGQPRLDGTIELITSGSGANRFIADLSGDIAPVLIPEFEEFIGPSVRLLAGGERQPSGAFDLSEFRLETAALQVVGSASLGADQWPEFFDVDIAIAPPEGETVMLPLPGAETSISGAELALAYDATRGNRWQLSGDISNLVQDGYQLRTIALAGTGDINRNEARANGGIEVIIDGLAPTDLSLRKALGPRLRGALDFAWSQSAPLSLRNIDLAGEDYGLRGALTISGLGDDGDLMLEPNINLQTQNLSRFDDLAGTRLRGAADLNITGQAKPLTGEITLQFAGSTRDIETGVSQLDPLLTGAGRLDMAVVRDTQGTRITPLLIQTQHARIDGSGTLQSGASRVEVNAVIPDVSRSLTNLTGAAQLTVRARQSGETWDINSVANLPGDAEIAYLGSVTGDGRNRLTGKGRLTADIGQLSAFSKQIDLPLSGVLALVVDGQADFMASTFDVTARGRSQALTFGVPGIAPLLAGASTFDLRATRDASGVIDLANLQLRTPAANATVSGQLSDAASSVTYQMQVGNIAVLTPDYSGPATLAGTGKKQGNTWLIDANATGPGGINLAANGRINQSFSDANARISGRVPLALANTQLDGRTLSGLANVQLALNGTPSLGSLSGAITLDNARFADPQRNLIVTGIQGRVDLAQNRARLDLRGAVSSGGNLRISGPVDLQAPFVAGLGIDLIDVTLRQASLYEVDLGGRVTLDGPLSGGARIGGVIDIQTAEARIPNTGRSYSALDGLRHLNPSAPVRRTLTFAGLDDQASTSSSAVSFPLDLLIRAPSRIFVRGRGLDAELGGTLRLTGTSRDVVPVGRFDLIRGRLDILGRRLALTDGSVVLRGSFDPVISFAASTTVDDVIVSLQLQGLASAPELTVTSSPELPEDEALSLLLFGLASERISPFQAIQLAAAIRTLTGQGGLGLGGRIRENLGVDDLDLSINEDGTTQASVGKYITDGVYTDATVKSDGTTQIELNLQLNPTLKLRGHVSNDGDTGVGIFFEKDY